MSKKYYKNWMAIRYAPPASKPVRAKNAHTEKKHAGGRPKLDKPKALITLRLDQDVIAKFKATGKGWQVRINDLLKAAKP